MPGVQDGLQFDPTRVPVQGPADTRPVPSIFHFDWDANQASAEQGFYDVPGRSAQLRAGEIAAAAAQLAQLQGKRGDAYYVTNLGEPVGDVPQVDEQAFWRDLAQVRRTQPAALKDLGADRADYDQRLRARFVAQAADRSQRMARGGAIGNLPGAAIGSFTDPVNIATLPIGGGEGSVAAQIVRNTLINSGITVVQQPFVALERDQQGGALTLGEAATNVAGAGLGAGVLTGAGHALAAALAKIPEALPLDLRMARALRDEVPDHALSPEQAAALHVLERRGEIDTSNPFQHTTEGLDAHAQRVDETLAALAGMPEPAPPAGETEMPAMAAASPHLDAAWSAIVGIEGGTNRDGSFRTSPAGAVGPAQVMEATGPQAAKLAGLPWDPVRWRTDAAYNAAIGRAYYEDLTRQFGGDPVKAAAAYNAGPGSAAKGTGLRGAMARAEAAGRPQDWVSFLPSETQAYVINFQRRTGLAQGDAIPVAETGEPLDVRPEAMDAVRPSVTAVGREIPITSYAPGEIGIDAGLMQFKSGGDAQGVTDRLHGVQQWDPIAAGMATVWEGLDGRVLIADGHQRLGLARRLAADNPDLRLNAFVLREADGFSAADARVITALKNIGEGTGSTADAAKVFRDVDLDPEALKRLPPRSALVRDGKALARLSDEAFGAVVNEVVPESYGAAVGALAPDPATHMALIDLLAKTEPTNRRQAEAIVRQALDAGFTSEHQNELFGGRDVVSALFAEKAKALDRTLSELRKLKAAFSVAAHNAEALDAAGNKIDVAASTAAAEGNARALALVEALALRKGNGVSEIFNRAAQRLADGEPLTRVARDSAADLRGLDLERALADAGGSRGPAGGSGRLGELDRQISALSEDARPLDPAAQDQAEADGLFGPPLVDEHAGKLFDDPAGEGASATADSLWHDIEAAGAEVQGHLIDLDDGKGPRTIAEIRAELTADEADISTIESCIAPKGGGA